MWVSSFWFWRSTHCTSSSLFTSSQLLFSGVFTCFSLSFFPVRRLHIAWHRIYSKFSFILRILPIVFLFNELLLIIAVAFISSVITTIFVFHLWADLFLWGGDGWLILLIFPKLVCFIFKLNIWLRSCWT